MLRVLSVIAVMLALVASPSVAETTDEIKAEPIVKLQAGETAVTGQCLTQQELDLITQLNALRRPTVGAEGDDEGDDPAPFDPHYFLGTWEIEGVLPESPLGEAGEFIGTETVRHVEGCIYESTIEATIADEPITITSRLIYDRNAKYLVRIEDDSRGFQLVKVGMLRGDSGGYSSHHWEAPSIARQGSALRLRGRTYMTSPFAYRLRMQLAVDDEGFTNFGTVWWERVESAP